MKTFFNIIVSSKNEQINWLSFGNHCPNNQIHKNPNRKKLLHLNFFKVSWSDIILFIHFE